MNHACDEDSDCINRLTLMECGNDGCGCSSVCSNQRFQTHDYADVSVFKTEKKGFGLRANTDISRWLLHTLEQPQPSFPHSINVSRLMQSLSSSHA